MGCLTPGCGMEAPAEITTAAGLEPLVATPPAGRGRVRALAGIWVPAAMLIVIFFLCFIWPLIGSVPSPTDSDILNSNLPSFSPPPAGHRCDRQRRVVTPALRRAGVAGDSACRQRDRPGPRWWHRSGCRRVGRLARLDRHAHARCGDRVPGAGPGAGDRRGTGAQRVPRHHRAVLLQRAGVRPARPCCAARARAELHRGSRPVGRRLGANSGSATSPPTSCPS